MVNNRQVTGPAHTPRLPMPLAHTPPEPCAGSSVCGRKFVQHRRAGVIEAPQAMRYLRAALARRPQKRQRQWHQAGSTCDSRKQAAGSSIPHLRPT